MHFRDSSAEVALRNEEINRRRLQAGARGNGPLKITDPAAFSRLMEDMRIKAEQQKELKDKREAERARREGDSYKSPEQRSQDSRESRLRYCKADEEEAQQLGDRKFDPSKDYYAILGLDRASSAAEVRRAYKRMSLLYHPDKVKFISDEEREAVEAQFREVARAFDVLTDEEQRSLYDKCRDWMDANPGKGLPPLSPEESMRVANGAAELRRLRRMGPKLAKHPPIERTVEISLHKLNSGCTRAVLIERRRVDYSGKEYCSPKTFHLVIRKGSREGDKLVFEGEGNETVDTHPGDLIFTLAVKSNSHLKRRGDKDLEMFAGVVPFKSIHHISTVKLLSGAERLVLVPALREALVNDGVGGIYKTVIPGQGLFDAKHPWDSPPGSLHVEVRYPPCMLTNMEVVCHLHRGALWLLGSRNDKVSMALVAGAVAAELRHRIESKDMMNDSLDVLQKTPKVLCLSICLGCDNLAWKGPWATRVLASVLSSSIPGCQVCFGHLNIHSSSMIMEDTAWMMMHEADVIVIDAFWEDKESTDQQGDGSCAIEDEISHARRMLLEAGIMEALVARHLQGCALIALEFACGLIDVDIAADSGNVYPSHCLIPWYCVRPGGGHFGWENVINAKERQKKPNAVVPVVGIMKTAAYVISPVSGYADLFIAPTKDVLIATALSDHGGKQNLIDGADDEHDFGFPISI